MFSVAAIAILGSRPVAAYTMYVEWTDVVGEITTVGDLGSVRLSFDSSGSWEALWRADPLRPFTGNIAFNLNLTDRDFGDVTQATGPQVSLSALHDFGSGTATSFTYSGSEAFLGNWQAGHRVITSNIFVGAHGRYASGIEDLNVSSQRDRLSAQATIMQAVPEPETYAMMLIGLGLLGVVARRRKQAPMI
jgi:hypothetical protein